MLRPSKGNCEMARPKSLIKNINITEAKRAHNCKSNVRHRIIKGDFRLTVKEGQDKYNYCVDCGIKFLDKAIADLRDLRASLLD